VIADGAAGAPRITFAGGVLTIITSADAAPWLAGEDDAQVQAFEFPHPATLSDVERGIERWRASWADGGPVRQWAVRVDEDGPPVGGVELRDLGEWQRANLSYVIFPPFRRRGLATAAARAAVRWGATHLGVRDIHLEVRYGNVASLAVARRLGATEVGPSTSPAGTAYIVFALPVGELTPEP
jgi:RimJ/RimL family protein N-acetyltransferase